MEDGELLHNFEGHTNYVKSVAIHPSEEDLATGSKDKTRKLWSLEANKLLYTSEDEHTEAMNSIAFSPNGNDLISGSDDKTVNIEDINPAFDMAASFFHQVFKGECIVDDNSADVFDWNESDTRRVLREGECSCEQGASRATHCSPYCM